MIGLRYTNYEELVKDYPELKHHFLHPYKEQPRLQVGDTFTETRHNGLIVTLEVVEVRPDLGMYLCWNQTRQVNNFAPIDLVDNDYLSEN